MQELYLRQIQVNVMLFQPRERHKSICFSSCHQNIHLDDPLNSSSQQFTHLSSSTNVTQHVSVSTHIYNHTLDRAIISSHTNLFPTISQSLITVSDHFPIFTHLNLTPTSPPPFLNLPFFAPTTRISLNSITTSLHQI